MLKTIQEAVEENNATPKEKTIANTTNKIENVDKITDNDTSKTTTDAAAKVNKAISESTDLIKALECVGAMYGIPATHIISDDAAKSIKVIDDNIIAPPLPNPIKYNKPIIQAIGGVLDYISQRIDDKLNEYQMNNIQNGRIADVMKNADPSKGKCIGVYDDDEGGQILAYDTGIVDAPNTPAARMKIAELRANETIPAFDPSANRPSDVPGLSYFTDEDDIAADVDMSATSDGNPDEVTTECNDVAKKIQESAYHVNLCSKYGNTTHLGYDMLQRHGFDFVKPMDSVVMEAKTDDKEETKKKVHASDIKHLKFDNKNILKAVEYFNKAREEQEATNKMNLDKFINDPNFEKAITCLNNQFDCRINIRFMTTDKGKYENCATMIEDELKKKLTISKSKGFQLGGLPIDIYVYNHFMESSSPKDKELFGQNMVSVICHEIFHNISYVMRKASANDGLSLAMTLDLAMAAEDPKNKRIIVTNYVDTIGELSKIKAFDKIAKKKLIKALTTMATVSENNKASANVKKALDNKNPDRYMDEMIKKHKKAIRELKPHNKGVAIATTLIGAAGIVASAVTGTFLSGGIIGLTCGFTFIGLTGLGGGMLLANTAIDHMQKKYEGKEMYEEFYCDLFAGMYQLPVFFFVGPSKQKYVANDFKKDKLNELANLERDLYKYSYATYPTELERCHAAVSIAKTILKQKDVDPAIKKYCEWVIENFSNVHNTDIDTIYNTTTFNPKEAEDLDKHLENLIKDNNITVTESFVQWLNN